jgi:hypothetical protein
MGPDSLEKLWSAWGRRTARRSSSNARSRANSCDFSALRRLARAMCSRSAMSRAGSISHARRASRTSGPADRTLRPARTEPPEGRNVTRSMDTETRFTSSKRVRAHRKRLTVVHPRHTTRLVREHRFDGGPFIVGEFVAHDDSRLRFGSWNHVPGDAINPQRPIKGRFQSPDFTSAFGGTADMAGPATGLVLVAIDPKATSAGGFCCDAQLSRFAMMW